LMNLVVVGHHNMCKAQVRLGIYLYCHYVLYMLLVKLGQLPLQLEIKGRVILVYLVSCCCSKLRESGEQACDARQTKSFISNQRG